MLDHIPGDPSFFLGDYGTLRQEAMQLFEESLLSGDESALVAFIERQLAQDPPQLYLLRQIADELEMHLLALREHHFDVRERVVTTLHEHYGVDLTPLTSADRLNVYHQLQLQEVMAYVQQQAPTLEAEDETLLRQMIAASLEMAGRLQHDIAITTRVYSMITDWLEGLSVTLMRRFWPPHDALFYDTEPNMRH